MQVRLGDSGAWSFEMLPAELNSLESLALNSI